MEYVLSTEGHGQQDKHDMPLQYYKNCTKHVQLAVRYSCRFLAKNAKYVRGGGVDTKLESVQGGVGAILSARAPTNTCTAVTRNQSTKTAINACRYIHQRCKAIDPKD